MKMRFAIYRKIRASANKYQNKEKGEIRIGYKVIAEKKENINREIMISIE